MEDKILIEYKNIMSLAEKLKEKEPLIPLHIFIMFELKDEKQKLIKEIITHFDKNKASHWNILLDARIFHNVDEGIAIFRKKQIEDFGFSIPYLMGQQIGSKHFIISLDVNNVDINIEKLNFIFNIIQYDSLGFKHIFLSKNQDYFNNLSIVKRKDGFYALLGRYTENEIIKDKDLSSLMMKIKMFIDKKTI